MDQESVRRVAAALQAARRARTPGPPPRDLGVSTLADAYRVQKLTRASSSDPRHFKVGVTSAGLQAALGVDHPAYGALPDAVEESGAGVALDSFIQPLLEVEVAFVLGRAPADPTDASEVRAAVAEVRVAIEIADCRTAGWDIRLVDLVADAGCTGAAVLGGQPVPPDALPPSFTASLCHDGTEIATGGDHLVVGGPWSTLAWLAAELDAAGLGLSAGSVVLTGSCTPPTAPRGPGRYVGRVEDLGEVSVTFS
jgi:2-keto-4-pentenoate hydratase